MPQWGQALSQEFGKGFDATNLRHMRGIYLAFPKRDALRRELSWTHYRLVLPSEDELRAELERDRQALETWARPRHSDSDSLL